MSHIDAANISTAMYDAIVSIHVRVLLKEEMTNHRVRMTPLSAYRRPVIAKSSTFLLTHSRALLRGRMDDTLSTDIVEGLEFLFHVIRNLRGALGLPSCTQLL
jgi:hypothetical protein